MFLQKMMKNIDWRTRPFDLPTSDTVWLCYVGDKLTEMVSSTIANLNIIDKLANHTVHWDSMRWSTTSKNKFKWLTLKSWFLTKKRNVSQYYLQQSFSGLHNKLLFLNLTVERWNIRCTKTFWPKSYRFRAVSFLISWEAVLIGFRVR